MKKTLAALTLITASISNADIIKCIFTEPFVNSTYSTTQSTLTYKDYENKTKVIKGVSFQIKAAGAFELVKNGKVLQSLTLSQKGSDGMSDKVYPYEVMDTDLDMMANGGHGGCSSNYLKATEEQR